jgi:sugar transferase (PEP-CTERM/EpsH1 system associated)
VKVLFVCHRVPYPPKRGGKIRPFNIIRHLTTQGHEVTVASLARSAEEVEQARGLSDYCARVMVEVIPDRVAWSRMVAWLPTSRPSSFGYFYSGTLARQIEQALRASRYDLVFVHCSSVAPYVQSVTGPVKIFDYGDVDSQKWREYAVSRPFPLSAGYWLEAVKLERTERLLSQNFDLCTCTTRAELATLRELGVTVPTDWFPNGVDTEFFAPSAAEHDRELIAFVGRMDYFPNQQAVQNFCRDVFPKLRARVPGVRFAIVGADPSRAIRELAQIEGVTVTGSVPDVRPHVTRAALTIAPLEIARGTQNKILESMAMGVPVVCSRQASGGVDAVAGEHLLTATGADGYVEAIARVLASPDERRRLALAGRARVLSHHSWSSSMRRLDGLVESAFGSRARAA